MVKADRQEGTPWVDSLSRILDSDGDGGTILLWPAMVLSLQLLLIESRRSPHDHALSRHFGLGRLPSLLLFD